MQVIQTKIPDLLLLEPQVFGDDRGFFLESWNQRRFDETVGRSVTFVQDNHSRSGRGVLRGLHYQLPPAAQAKLVRCVVGEVFDVAVDLRRSSATFGHWVGIVLSADNKRQLWIPEGFAHAFLVLSEVAEFFYKTTAYYAPEYERCICWDDPDLAIDWPLKQPLLSDKDRQGQRWHDVDTFF